MAKLLKLLIAFLICYSQIAIAQNQFEGFYGQISTGYESNHYSSIRVPFDIPGMPNGQGTASNQSKSSASLIVSIGHIYPITKEYLIGLGIEYSGISQKSSSFSKTATINGNTATSNESIFYKASDQINLFIAPSYALSTNSLAYLKIGYSSKRLEYTQGLDSTLQITNNSSTNKRIHGYVLGFGYKQMLTGRFYGFAEANYMDYGKSTLSLTNAHISGSITSSPNQSVSGHNLLIGVGYKF